MFVLLCLLLCGIGLAAEPGSEIVVVLDNSCSMAVTNVFNGQPVPPNDPERLAVLGAAAVADLGSTGIDRVTVIGFGDTTSATPPTTTTHPDLRDWPYSNGTFFRRPLGEAKRILSASQRAAKLLIFFTDGVPSPEENIASPADMRAIFNPDAQPDVSVLAVGLFSHPAVRQTGSALLGALTRSPDDLKAVDSPGAVVDAFTMGFARAIGSRPETGQLSAGQSHTVSVGKYVSEVLAIAVSAQPGPAFSATLDTPWAAEPPIGSGDNGCSAAVAQRMPPEVCAQPRRHYQVFRSDNNPDHKSTWKLTVARGGPVDFGVILRYDLTARIEVSAEVAAGTAVPITGRLIFRGKTFDDADFFGADGFTATARIGDQEVPLTHAGGGVFSGTWTPTDDSDERRQAIAQVTFSNSWMEQSASQTITITPPPYLLVLDGPLTLSAIPSRWAQSSLCGDLSLARSRNIADVEVDCTVRNQPFTVDFTCTRPDANTLRICASTRRWCCGKEGEVTVTAAGPGGTPPRTAASVVVPWKVEHPGLLRCYWLPITLTGLALVGIWFIVGWIRPYSFEPSAAITLAGSEKGLRRATPQVLRECPGGKRGFYRNARICLSGAGDLLKKPRHAMIVIEAGPGQSSVFVKAAGLESRDRRKRTWDPLTVEELGDGFVPGTLYRLGDLHIRFE